MTVRTIDEIFRDFVTDGVPASGPFNPHKPDIRDTLKALTEGSQYFPDNRVIRLNNANAGTANNIVVTASVAIPAAAYQVLYILNVTQENTGPVKVSGAINRDLVTNTSRPIEPGYLKPGMALLCIDTGTQLRLLSYGNAEAILAAAEAAADRAEAAAEAAEAAAGSLSVNFETIALAKAANIPAVVKYILAAGRNAVGDGDGGMYIRVASPALGSNITQNGDFSSDTGWIKGTGWTIASGKASKAITASQSELGQTTSLVPGETYAVTFTIADYSGSGWVRPYLAYNGTAVVGTQRTTNGTYTDYLTAAPSNGRVSFQAQATVACSIDNVSVRKVADAFQSADGAWWELRANVADKNVLTPSTPSMGISSTKIKDDLSGKFSGAVVRIVSDKFQDLVSARDFGAFGMSNDYTTELQTFINQCMPTGLKLLVPTGEYGLSGSGISISSVAGIPIENSGGSNPIAKRSRLTGEGPGSTIFRYSGTASAVTIITASSRQTHGNFSIVKDNATKSGTGLTVLETATMAFENIFTKGFDVGLQTRDCFSLTFNLCEFDDNRIGWDANYTTISRPNDFNFHSCHWRNNDNFGAFVRNPVTLNIVGGTFEGNGSGGAEHCGLRIFGSPNDGSMGLNASGVYYEGNYGDADIIINNDGSGPAIHRIVGCTFNRISPTQFVTNSIRVYRNHTNYLGVKIGPNAFNNFNGYTPDALRKFVRLYDTGGNVVNNNATNGPVINYDFNLFGNTLETPSL